MAEPFANPNALQLAVMARLNLLSYKCIENTSATGFSGPVHDEAAMNAVGLYMGALQGARAPGSGFLPDQVDMAVREMYDAVVEADRLWPKGGDGSAPLSQVVEHRAAVKKVQEIGRRYGFTDREGYLLAYPEPAH